MNLFVNYFKHPNKDRAAEIDSALTANLNNPIIENVIVLGKDDPVEHKKIRRIQTEDRPTYQDFFDLTREYEGVNIVANSDISFDESLSKANPTDRVCYAITRTEMYRGGLCRFEFRNRNCKPQFAQDVWMFRGGCKVNDARRVMSMKSSGGYEEIDFCMGIPGCDNVIAHKLKRAYAAVLNPRDHIRCIHHHQQDLRPVYSHRITGDRSRWGVITSVQISGL